MHKKAMDLEHERYIMEHGGQDMKKRDEALDQKGRDLKDQRINNDMINNQAIVKQMRVERINRLQLQKQEDSSFLERIIKNNQTHKRDLFHAQAQSEQWKKQVGLKYIDADGNLKIINQKTLQQL